MTQKPAQTLQIKFLMKSIEENRCLSRKFKYFFYILHIYLGLDFGFMKFKSFRAKVITKIIIVTYCMVFLTLEAISMFSSQNNIIMIVWMTCYLLGYAFYVLMTNFLPSDKLFCDLQNDLLAIDSEIGADSRSYSLELKLIFLLSSATVIRIFYGFGFCYVSHLNCWSFSMPIVLNISHYLSNDVMMIMYSFVFYSVCCRVTKFIDFIKKDGTDIVSCEYIYRSMLDSTQEAMKTFEVIFIVCLFCNTPQIMMAVYCVIAFVKKSEFLISIVSPLFVLSGSVTMFQAFLMMFLPSYFGGQLSAENDNLKLALHKILLRETGCVVMISDDVRSKDLKRFIKYIEARPLTFTVLKIIPVDWTLPVLIINISVTYLIVAVQITHLY